jgi:hypothetical protein
MPMTISTVMLNPHIEAGSANFPINENCDVMVGSMYIAPASEAARIARWRHGPDVLTPGEWSIGRAFVLVMASLEGLSQ